MKFTILPLMLLFLCAGHIYALDTTGLMLYLPFNEGSGTVANDASGNGNNGELKGNAEWVAGQYGMGVHLHQVSDEWVEVPHSDSLDIRQAITLELWIKVVTMVDHCAFISKATEGQEGAYLLHISNNNGLLYCPDHLYRRARPVAAACDRYHNYWRMAPLCRNV